MRADLAPLAATALYLFAGFGVLAALGLVRRSLGGVLAAAGLAYLSGVAAVLLPGIFIVTLGIRLGLGGVVAIAAAIGLAGLLAAWRRRSPRRASGATGTEPAGVRARLRRWGAERWAAAAFVAALAAYAVAGYLGTTVEPLAGWDAMSIWSRKALLLVEFGKPTAAFFGSPFYEFMNPDYPILLPMYESVFFRIAGTADFQALHGQFWILFIAFIWSSGYLASRIARPLAWAPLVAMLAVTPALADDIQTLYADVPMALFLGTGVLLLGLWFSEGGARYLALATLMLGAAANTKNEGLAAAAGVMLVALVVSVLRFRSSAVRAAVGPPLAAAAGLAIAVAPWRVWVAANDVPNVTTPVEKGLNPGFLADHAGRIGPTVSAIGGEVGDPTRWFYLLPLAVALAIATLWVRRDRWLVAFYAGAAAVVFVSILIWGYVVNTIPIDSLISTTVSRTVDGFMLVAIAALLHLSADALPVSERLTSRRMTAGEQGRGQPAPATHD